MPCSLKIRSFAYAASCVAIGICTQPDAAALPVNVSFPSQTVLSTAQPYGSSVIVADFDGRERVVISRGWFPIRRRYAMPRAGLIKIRVAIALQGRDRLPAKPVKTEPAIAAARRH